MNHSHSNTKTKKIPQKFIHVCVGISFASPSWVFCKNLWFSVRAQNRPKDQYSMIGIKKSSIFPVCSASKIDITPLSMKGEMFCSKKSCFSKSASVVASSQDFLLSLLSRYLLPVSTVLHLPTTQNFNICLKGEVAHQEINFAFGSTI